MSVSEDEKGVAGDRAVVSRATPKPRIVHIITGLGQGGAESVLHRLICATRDNWDIVVVSLKDEGYYGKILRSLGIEVHCCNMRGLSLSGLRRLGCVLRDSHADVVQTWMYHADLFGGIAARLGGCRAIVWGIRNLGLYRGRVSSSARLAAKLSALLSGVIPAAIVSCSAQAATDHIRRGYVGERMVVIPNGYDCRRLSPDGTARDRLRAEWGVLPEHFLVGMVARWDPLKDHANLLQAVREFMLEHAHVRCVLVGPQMDLDNGELAELLRGYEVSDRIILAGPRDDIPSVMNAMDLHVLSSVSEAFPNVVAEAMACGTPCVSTDVGDARLIIGEYGWLVPPSDSMALSRAMSLALDALSGAQGAALRTSCRDRILHHFSEESMVASFERVWSGVIAGTPRARAPSLLQ